MGVRLIYGRVGSGKSTFCFNEIKENINLKNKVYIITPEQFSYSAEKKLLEMMTSESVIGVEVISFKRMAERVESEVGKAKKTAISKARKSDDFIFNTTETKGQFEFPRKL